MFLFLKTLLPLQKVNTSDFNSINIFSWTNIVFTK